MSDDEVRHEILATLRRLGDASDGQIAARLRLPTPRVEAVLGELLRRGEVAILPLSLTWAVS